MFCKTYSKKYNDYQVINLDALTYAGNIENLDDVKDNPNYRFVHGNICDKKLAKELIIDEGVDAVINFAAESHVDRSITGPEIFIETNVQGTLNLLQAAKEAKPKDFYRYQLTKFTVHWAKTDIFTKLHRLHQIHLTQRQKQALICL